MPRIAIIPEDTPNAFATGRNPEHAVVAVTEGIMRILSRPELEAVLAHELGHVKHRDILVGSLAAVLALVIFFLSRLAGFFGARDEEGRSNPIASIAIMILGPLAAILLQMAVSRSREYMADEYSARLTGRPDMLASALERLHAYNTQPHAAGPHHRRRLQLAQGQTRAQVRLRLAHHPQQPFELCQLLQFGLDELLLAGQLRR